MERKELLEYRTPTTKHFLKRDGTIDVEIYDENIHYLKNGKYEIDLEEQKKIENRIKQKMDSLWNN